MNIVKGVADLIRRSSSGYGGDSSVGSSLERLAAPTPRIRFSEDGDEGILNTFWGRYVNADDKVERKKLQHIFLKQFIIVYKNWEPVNLVQSPDSDSSSDVIGCSSGHPAEVITMLIDEVTQLTTLITELALIKSKGVISTTDQFEATTGLTITPEGVAVLDALTLIVRSMHNCRVFGHYAGIQKLTALMKAAVVQLKTITSALSVDETLSESTIEKIDLLQKLLVLVVAITCSYISLDTNLSEKAQSFSHILEINLPTAGGANTIQSSSSSVDSPISEERKKWHQKAVVSVMEAGGLNWLVELLRVMRRLSLKEQWTEMPLQYLTLCTLQSALSDNPRGQNHFRSIGGLEVLLDGLGVASNNYMKSKNRPSSGDGRDEHPLLGLLQLHVLSMEVLREAVFGNLNNLQFLFENGRVQKFANSFCSPAFMIQEFNQQSSDQPVHADLKIILSENSKKYSKYWRGYTIKLSRALSSFLLSSEDLKSQNTQPSGAKITSSVSSVYGELSIKWIMRVLVTVFPCIKACSNQNELPSHLRVLIYTLQRYALFVFRKVLVLSPSLLDVFRAEGVWDFIFSENFFYFGLASAEFFENHDEVTPWNQETVSDLQGGCEVLQIEVISFVKYAATLDGSSHNLPECSVLLDALEQSAFNPESATLIADNLLRILRLSTEKTVSSFKALDAISRVLKVTCILAQESKRPSTPYMDSNTEFVQNCESPGSPKTTNGWIKSMETLIELFTDYLYATDDAKKMVLHSSTCIDSLFDLFWEESLRNRVLSYILDLMKIPYSEVNRKPKLYLCSKYLETFPHVKERERNFAELSVDLLVGMRDMLLTDEKYYQTLFRDGECFLHVVSLLNGNLDEANGEKLVRNVLQTLTCLLKRNESSKAAFRALVGKGYQTLQSLLLDFCQSRPCEGILDSLLDMLVDGKFDLAANPVIKNEDVILLYLSVLQKSSGSLRHHGLNLFLQILRDSICNRASCVRAGMLNFLLDWFTDEDDDSVVLKIAQLIQVIGGHSISGKEIRKIFALLRSEKVGSRQQYCSLLLTSILSMLNENGPTAFFDLNGNDSGIIVKTPVQWPLTKGFSFSCWLRIESMPTNGGMGLYSCLTETGRGCLAVLAKDKIIYESINQKRQSVSLPVNLLRKKWHFLCLTHSIGRAFSGGSQLRCYVDGVLVSSEKCRYSKVAEPLTNITIAAKINFHSNEEDSATQSIKDSLPFFGQIGPVYMFNDALTSEQVRGIFSLGPSYMYSFLDNEVSVHSDNPLPCGILDAKDGLASKIIFGLNAQASNGRTLFNVSPLVDHHALDKRSFEAIVETGTQLCSRRLLKQIIYCVGGVSVFFPLFTQSELYENEERGHTLLTPITKERLTAEIIELIASVLDENLANQQQMLLLSGFSVLGFLLQSVPPQQLNMETLSALKHMFNVVTSCGVSELLVKDAISHIFLNPFIWVYTVYKVQRELYMFLIQKFDNDPRLLESLCRLPRVLDIIRIFYWDNGKSRYVIGSKPLLHPVTNNIIGERPSKDEIRKIRLLLLSLGEMSLRQAIAVSDIKALVAFFELDQDLACIEDVLHMIIRAVTQKPLLASFLEQVNLIGGCHVFVNLLQRDCESIRMLSLQLLGRLLVGLPSEKKGSKFFNISVGKPKLLLESNKRTSIRMQTIFSVISDSLFRFSQTDLLCATLFDVLLGGASPKQVLQKNIHLEGQKSRGSNSQFILPQILVLIFRFLTGCESAIARVKILNDILDLLDSNPSNIEAFMENGWNAWLVASTKLDVLKSYKADLSGDTGNEYNEKSCVRRLFCVVLCYYIHSVKGGWQYLEETMNYLLMQHEHGGVSYQYLLRDIYEDIIQRLIELSMEDNILVVQPCRDNTLYLLKLIDELLISEMDNKLPFPASGSDFSPEFLELESHKDIGSALDEAMHGDPEDNLFRNSGRHEHHVTSEHDNVLSEKWWNIYDKLWIIISLMNGKGPSNKVLPKSSSAAGPSFGQRARVLVESLNIPAAEMAAVVVSGGISNALGKPNKMVDKAMLLRSERCPRIVFRLLILYLCKAPLEKASKCVQQVIPLLCILLTADDEHSKSRLQLFIWSLLAVRSHYGTLDDGARFHVIAHLIRETVNYGKSMLATSIIGRDDSPDSSSTQKEAGAIQNLVQKDRVLAAAADEVKYIKISEADKAKQLKELSTRIEENSVVDTNQKKEFEDEIRTSINEIIASDESRRDCFQLVHEEEQQTVAEKWIHMLRSLIDERGPWSANPFPNTTITHWKLDKTEDAWRRRQKLRRNYHFDEKLCLPPTSLNSDVAVTPTGQETKAGFGVHIPEQMRRFLLKGIRRITDEGSSEPAESDAESSTTKGSSIEDSSDRVPDVVKDGDQKDTQERKDSSISTEEASEVLMSVPCVLVTPKRKLAGHLAVMKKYLHFFGEFIVEGSGGSSIFKNFNNVSGNTDPSKQEQKQKSHKWPPIDLEQNSEKGDSDSFHAGNGNLLRKHPKNIKRYRRWNICKINGVHWTRYLLRYTAIEIFFNNSVAPIFLNFASLKEAKEIGTLIVSTRNESMFPKGYNKDKSAIISFVDRRVALEMAESARESWRRRDITNFEYLMILNTLAGRSYNDLTQYPVFPWILADYSSETLDFNKSATFRDLSKPIGALDSKRFEVFEDRYRNFCDPDIPSFYYGSHYSSMGIVLYYLLRLEPFTALHRNLQGGKFDHADRLFQSIDSTYKNCLSNTSDVKELVPEFFYMPEFLANSNSYHLGVKQDGQPLTNVCLPPWAKGSPEEFISKNREALESEYVSSNLHQWIDLVFGYKQRGKPAVEAANIFYYLTYEGAVDLDTMDDDLQRSAIEDQIANFGQTPIQIFRKKHPRRGPPIPIAHPLRFAPASINLTSLVSSTSNSTSAILYISTIDSQVVLVNEGLTMLVKMWLTTQLHSGNFTFSGSQLDPYFGVGSDILSPRKIGSPSAEYVEVGAQCFATLRTPSENFLISCGNWENSFQVISLNDGRMLQSIRQHKDVVSCVAVTSCGSILVTGSYDTTVMVWEVVRAKTPDKRIRITPSEMPRKDYVISETPFHILCGHDDIITCLYVSVELDIVISGSKDGTCVFHTLREGRYVRSLSHPSGGSFSKLVASHHGRILFYADDDLSLHLYSINGKHLTSSESNGRLNCIELSSCGEFLVCAGDQGQIVVRSMNSLEIVRKYSGIGRVITSLTVTQEECFLAGTKEGSLLVYSIENPQLRKTSVVKNQKPKISAS
jgi:WD40 repeat protein